MTFRQQLLSSSNCCLLFSARGCRREQQIVVDVKTAIIIHWREGCSFGVRMKEHQKEVEAQEGRKYTRSSRKQSQSDQNRTNLQSQITSTKKITSSTGTRPRSSPVSQTRLQGGFARQPRSDRRVRVS